MFNFLFLVLLVYYSAVADGNVEYLKCAYLSRALPCMDSRYRTIDGSCNNMQHKNFGKSYWPYGRLLPPTYADGIHALPTMKDGKPLPSARFLSNLVFPPGNTPSPDYTLALMQMGQLITHDVAFAEGTRGGEGKINKPSIGCCGSTLKFGTDRNKTECEADIIIPPNDPDYSQSGGQCLGFGRAPTTADYFCKLKNFDEQITIVTSYLDLSFLYGSTTTTATSLRAFSGGKLRGVQRNGVEWPPNMKSACPGSKAVNESCYLMGDDRANQNPQLTTLQLLFWRLHNLYAEKLAKLNPKWNDETLYQETRRICIALYQHFVYDEILPKFIAKEIMEKYELINPNPGSCYNDYDNKTDGTVLQEFATGAFRYFHTQIAGLLNTYNAEREFLQSINISDFLIRGAANELNNKVNFDTLLMGLTVQPQAETDSQYDQEIKSKLFKNDKTNLGSDLVSTDIQRGRDTGLARYVDVRKAFNLPAPSSWDDLATIISPKTVEKLKPAYGDVNLIDYLVAGNMEPHLPNSLSGPTHGNVIGLHFRNARKGDKYFYENCESHKMTPEQVAAIKKVPLAKVFCENSFITKIQLDVTKIVSDANPLVNCDDIPSLDLSLWKNEPIPSENMAFVYFFKYAPYRYQKLNHLSNLHIKTDLAAGYIGQMAEEKFKDIKKYFESILPSRKA